MPEKLTLTTPITHTSTSEYSVDRLDLNWKNATIRIELHSNNNAKFEHDYVGEVATTLMLALNKANLTSNSLHRRIINRLLNDGVLPAGTITGVPD